MCRAFFGLRRRYFSYRFVFKSHQNNGVIQLLYCDSCFRLRKLMSNMDHENKHSQLVRYYADLLTNTDALATLDKDSSRSRKRFLQEGEVAKTQNVTVDGCLFENNFRGSESGFADNGVIFIATASNQITIKNSIFRNNDFAYQDAGVPVSLLLCRSPRAPIYISNRHMLTSYFSCKFF